MGYSEMKCQPNEVENNGARLDASLAPSFHEAARAPIRFTVNSFDYFVPPYKWTKEQIVNKLADIQPVESAERIGQKN